MTTVERAYEIARLSKCTTILQIRNQLAREGYANGSTLLSGETIVARLKLIMVDRRRAMASLLI